MSRNKKAFREARKAIKEEVLKYKLGKGCKVCGETHPAVLSFHHTDPSQKDFNISEAVRNCWSIKKIRKEMSKCEIYCLNHHAMLHYEESHPTNKKPPPA